jgi:UDP-glucose 4-epimerase
VDLARAHLLALARLQSDTEHLVCNLGTGRGHSVREVIEVARTTTGRDIPARVLARRPGDAPRLVSDGTRARQLLGWEPLCSSLEQIMRDAWRFHSEHPLGFASRRAAQKPEGPHPVDSRISSATGVDFFSSAGVRSARRQEG